MRLIATIILLLLLTDVASSQKLHKKLILRDESIDSVLIKARDLAFDLNGNYYFAYKACPPDPEDNYCGRFFLVTNKGKIGPVLSAGEKYNDDGTFRSGTRGTYIDTANKLLIYKMQFGTKLFFQQLSSLPQRAEQTIWEEKISGGNNNVAISTNENGYRKLSINGSLIHTSDSAFKWDCVFNDGKDMLYYVMRDGRYVLYKSHKPIDSSTFAFNNLALNNSGFYSYFKKEDNGDCYIQTSIKRLGPVPCNVQQFQLNDDSSYYYFGHLDSNAYIAVNDRLHLLNADVFYLIESPEEKKEFTEFSPVIDAIAGNYVFACDSSYCVNGLTYPCPLGRFFSAAIDRQGNFAVLGRRTEEGYDIGYVYSKRGSSPGIRSHIIHMDPSGGYLHYDKEEDSTTICLNGKSIQSLKTTPDIGVRHFDFFLRDAPYAEDVCAVSNGDISYIWYGNELSKPIPIRNFESTSYVGPSAPRDGDLITGACNKHGYFLLGKVAMGKYILVTNNKVYKELNGIDEIFKQPAYFDGKEITFFGREGRAFYKYTVKL